MIPRILVVEDEETLLELIKVNLELEGYAVSTATNGIEALQAFSSTQTNAVITDLLMPQMDGWELVRELRKRFGAALPILVLSVLAKPEEGLAADLFLHKPFEMGTLLAAVRTLLASEMSA